MTTVLIIFSIIIILILVWHFSTLNFIDRYQQYLYLGIKGTGKTTTMTKWIYYYLSRGYTVYTDATDIPIDGLRIIDINDLGQTYGPYSIYFIDELSRYWDNRSYQNKEYREKTEKFLFWLKAIRHDHCRCFMFTQNYDVDIKIRSQCDKIVILQKYFRVLTVGRRLKKSIAMRDLASTADTQISQTLKYEPFFVRGSWEFTWIPKWAKKFDSFSDIMPGRKPLRYRVIENGKLGSTYYYDNGNNKRF